MKTENIAKILKNEIENYGSKVVSKEVGYVLTVGDGIAFVSGLEDAMFGEVVLFNNKIEGMIISLEESNVGVSISYSINKISEGDEVSRTNKVISTSVGDGVLGRVIDSQGRPLDGLGHIKSKKKMPIFKVASGVMTRQSVDEPLRTGILAIDSMIPIGKGQRELIIGDRQTGKTAIAIDAIINQKNENVYCIYVAIGQKKSSVSQIVKKLQEHNALEYTTIVLATASDSASSQYLAPYTGVTIGEEWMSQGKNVLIVYDDLSKHAIAYRTLSLLLRRPPGREAYPGDVFYLHSQLLERAAKLNLENGGGSITALPIVETQAADISSYIATNVISITDGQIFTMTNLFNSGQRPAIDAGYSVSRVGSAAQVKAMKKVASSLKLDIAQYNEMVSFSQFSSDLDKATKNVLNHGEKVMELMKQSQYLPITEPKQVIILQTVKSNLIDLVPTHEVRNFREVLIEHFETQKSGKVIQEEIVAKKEINQSLEKKLLTEIINVMKNFLKKLPDYDFEKEFQLPLQFKELGKEKAK